MASGILGASLKHLRHLFGDGTAVGLSDGELLRRYAASHDGPAFEALVARHGPMVASTCRAVLRDHHGVEDAFQATFLVLARKAGSIHAGDALGGWLHRVAFRAAVQRSIEMRRRLRAEVEVPSMEIPDSAPPGLDFDVCAILHEEIDRLPEAERLPVVLCDLEGLTYEQAASRLHCTLPTLYHRLAKGRKRLRDRLLRRGVTAAAVGAVLESSRALAAGAVPTAWATAVMAAATGGPIPPAVAALTHFLLRSLLMTRLKITTVAALAVGTLISVAFVALAATRLDPASPSLPAPSPATVPLAVADEPKPPADPGGRRASLTVEARDLATDALIPDVRFELSARDSSGSKVEFTSSTDGSGAARFSLTGEVHYLYLSAKRPGFVPQAIRWDYNANSPAPPDRFLFQMEKATTVSGRVVDQDNKPVAQAAVIIRVSKAYPRSRQWVDFQWEKTQTDAAGRWSFSGVPEAPDSIELASYHYRYLSEHDCYRMEDFKPLTALRDGSATLRLQRGTPVEVTVHSASGQPVANAEVFYGHGRRYANSIPPARTDAQGRLMLGIKPGTISTLSAQAPGCGPTLQTIHIGADPQRVELILPAAHVLRGRVVDPARKPIAGATVSLSWSGPETSARESRSDEAIVHQLKTDGDGRFASNDAPDRGVRVSAYASGFAVKQDLLLDADVDHEIVLTPPTLVKGSVVDAASGRPVPRFTLSHAAVWNPGERLIWQRNDSVDRDAKKAAGSFEYTFSYPAHQYILRVLADGYFPEDSGRFSPDGTPHAFTFRLTHAEPIRGTVTNIDGSPASKGFVYLVPAEEADAIEYLRIWNGEIRDHDRSESERAKVGPDGRFALAPQKGNFALVALSDAGFAIVHRRDLGDGRLRLQPWARISGTVTMDGEPAANLEILSMDPDRPLPIPGEPRIEHRYYVKTDAEGRFDLRRVMPGRLELARPVPNGVERRSWFINMATIEVASGQTYELAIGRSGRRVTGRLEIPGSHVWMVRKAEIVARKPKEKPPVSIGVEVLEHGRFRAQDVQPGDYQIRIALHEPPPANSCGWGRLIAAYNREFTVTDTADNSLVDLGLLRPGDLAGRSLKVGDSAPDFAFKTLDGKELTLAGFRGKFVLLDFWATWCAPCLAEIPNLEAVHKEFGADPHFVMVSLSLDEKPADVLSYVKSQKIAWHQGHIGEESATASAYNATAIPATFLIGPDGKIVAVNLRGGKIKTSVSNALQSRQTSEAVSPR